MNNSTEPTTMIQMLMQFCTNVDTQMHDKTKQMPTLKSIPFNNIFDPQQASDKCPLNLNRVIG